MREHHHDNQTVMALSATFSLSLKTARDGDSATSRGSPSQFLSAKKFLPMPKVDTAPRFLIPYCTYHSDRSNNNEEDNTYALWR